MILARAVSIGVLGLLLAAASPLQNGTPVNAMCPIKPNQKSKASLTVVYKGQVIGFC